ncbi:putative T7SS-secreted protein [Streptomyces sp. NPDC046988]|uniref:putative T7SS-secreted protein n=1 Tax=Streptomyces sp. NPDC046988 TaxID=3154922 RepID=UPI0033E19EE7
MSHRPTDWHVLDLESDPTPGDPQRIRKLAGTLHDFADDVGDVLRDLKGIAKEEEILSWAGKTAAVFAEEFGDAPKKLRKLKKSYNLAGDALTTFWPDLQDAQDKADKALRDGRKAREELTTAQTALTGADDWVRRATDKTDSYDPAKNGGKDVPKPDEADVRRATRDAQHAKARQAAAERNVESAQTALDAAKKLAGQAKGLREEAARRTVTKLREASDAGIPNRHWWEEIGDWVTDNWDEIVTICKWVVTIVGIIVMIVGGPLGWLVFAAALVVMADTIRKVIKGEAGWGDLLWAALDCIPATKGFTSLAKLGKLWKAGGLKALGAGFMGGIGGGLKTLAASLRGMRDGVTRLVQVERLLQTGGALRRVRGDVDFVTDWADEAYDVIRGSDDIDNIARTAADHGFSRSEVEQIKNHLFHEEHLLDSYGDAFTARFDANPRIAEAWQRLDSGNPHPADIDLLRHELHESNYMRDTGNQSYSTAHKATIDAGYTWDQAAAARDGHGRPVGLGE